MKSITINNISNYSKGIINANISKNKSWNFPEYMTVILSKNATERL